MADALFPAVRQGVLSALLTQPTRELHLREIARRAGLAPATVQREVVALTRAGILARRTAGRQVFYRANPQCPIVPELQGLMLKTVGLASVLAEALAPLGERVQYAAVFGSTAAGTALADSDVDLLVVGDVTLIELVSHLREARERLGREINIVSMSRTSLAAAVRDGEAFITNVLNGPHIALKGEWDELGRLAGSAATAAVPSVSGGDG
ncbi:nucleotidyltransferase domain-containing protein [bacterium]|nr:nucleotidyltransferase domain-containing protein [bacterium]